MLVSECSSHQLQLFLVWVCLIRKIVCATAFKMSIFIRLGTVSSVPSFLKISFPLVSLNSTSYENVETEKGEGHCYEFSCCLRAMHEGREVELDDIKDSILEVSREYMEVTSSNSSDTLGIIFSTGLSGGSSDVSVKLEFISKFRILKLNFKVMHELEPISTNSFQVIELKVSVRLSLLM